MVRFSLPFAPSAALCSSAMQSVLLFHMLFWKFLPRESFPLYSTFWRLSSILYMIHCIIIKMEFNISCFLDIKTHPYEDMYVPTCHLSSLQCILSQWVGCTLPGLPSCFQNNDNNMHWHTTVTVGIQLLFFKNSYICRPLERHLPFCNPTTILQISPSRGPRPNQHQRGSFSERGWLGLACKTTRESLRDYSTPTPVPISYTLAHNLSSPHLPFLRGPR